MLRLASRVRKTTNLGYARELFTGVHAALEQTMIRGARGSIRLATARTGTRYAQTPWVEPAIHKPTPPTKHLRFPR